jgi:TIR domain
MPANIFINYRKEDSRWNTEALYNELLKYFARESLFKDFNTIELGEDFVVSIKKALDQCDVLLIVIGKSWLDIKDQRGARRLNDDKDFVRIEIATALKRNIRIIPLLFDNVEMPQPELLPEDMQQLSSRQFLSISDTKFTSDVQKLAESIQKSLNITTNPAAGKSKKKRIWFSISFGIAFSLLAVLLVINYPAANKGNSMSSTLKQQPGVSQNDPSTSVQKENPSPVIHLQSKLIIRYPYSYDLDAGVPYRTGESNADVDFIWEHPTSMDFEIRPDLGKFNLLGKVNFDEIDLPYLQKLQYSKASINSDLLIKGAVVAVITKENRFGKFIVETADLEPSITVVIYEKDQ